MVLRIGIDLGGTKIEALALDAGGREVFRRRIPTPRENYAETLKAIGSLVEAAEAETGTNGSVGVGMPGALSRVTGLVKNANSTWLNGKPFKQDLQQVLRREVRVENDANCFALSEATDGAGEGARVVFGVILGTGVGGGILIDGSVLVGANAIAGEWGHNALPRVIETDLPLRACYCGRQGCIETYLAGPALEREHERLSGELLSSKDLGWRGGL